MQFNAVARGVEMLTLQVRDLVFTGDSVNAPIIGVLPITKNRKRTYIYFKFSNQIDISTCGFSAIQGWLCVLRAHGVDEGHLFYRPCRICCKVGRCWMEHVMGERYEK